MYIIFLNIRKFHQVNYVIRDKYFISLKSHVKIIPLNDGRCQLFKGRCQLNYKTFNKYEMNRIIK